MTNDLTHTAEWSTADKRNLVFDPDPPGTPLPPNSVVGPLHSKSTHHEMERKRHEYQSDEDDYDFKDLGQTTGGTSTHHVWITDDTQFKGSGELQVLGARPLEQIAGPLWWSSPTLELHRTPLDGNGNTSDGAKSGSKEEYHYFYHEDATYNPQGTKDGVYTKNEERKITNTTGGKEISIYAVGGPAVWDLVLSDYERTFFFPPSSTSYKPVDYWETGNHTDNEGTYTTTSGGVTGQPAPYSVLPGIEDTPPELREVVPPLAEILGLAEPPSLEAFIPESDLPRVIAELAEGSAHPGFLERLWQGTGIPQLLEALDGAKQLDGNIGRNRGIRSRLAEKAANSAAWSEQAINGQDAEWNNLLKELRKVATPGTVDLIEGLAEASVNINAASTAMVLPGMPVTRTGPVRSAQKVEEVASRRRCIDGHHPIPVAMSGDLQQAYSRLPRHIHNDFHRQLRDKLLRHGLPDASNTPAQAWTKYFLDNPGEQKRVYDLIKEASGEIDAKYGTDILSKFYANLRLENFREF